MSQERHGLNSSCVRERIQFQDRYHGTRSWNLQMLGFEILNADPNGRCVRRNGRTFLEGHLESMVAEVRDDAQEALGQGRPWGTTRGREN